MQSKTENKKVILTGATGVIGAAVIRQCKKRGWDVCAVVRPQSLKNKYIVETGAVIIPCDLDEIQTLEDNYFCKNADYFIHLGWAGTKKADRENNEIQQKNITYAVDACKVAYKLGCRAFVFAGSQAEYGRLEGCMMPDSPTNPTSEYGKAKLCAGMQTKELCKQYGMRHIYARILSVYGPCNELDTMIMSTIIQLLKGQSPSFTKGEQLWDYLYSDDAARALLLLAENGRSERIYCIGSGEVRQLKEYMECIGKVINPEISLGIGELPYAPNQVMELYADITSLQEDTGFIPEIDFEDGIRLTAKWIVSNGLDKE